MTDHDVLEYFNLVNTKRCKITPVLLNTISDEMRSYLESRFTEYSSDDKITEAIYRIFYKMEELKHCQICGTVLNYKTLFYRPNTKVCSKECQNKLNAIKLTGRKRSPETDAKIKKTMLERYGVMHCTQCPDILKRRTQTNIERYGGPSPACRQDIKQKMYDTNIERYGHRCTLGSTVIKKKVKATNLERYGTENVFASDAIKERIRKTNNERYGVDNWKQSEAGRQNAKEIFADGTVKAKEIATKKKNGTLNSSRQEERMYDLLKELYPDYTLIREYKEERYLFYCDFWIKELDVFIELNLHYTHGSHPYNPESKEDQERLTRYKDYHYIIDVRTVRDPKKLEVAKSNNLRYIAVYDPKFTKESIQSAVEDVLKSPVIKILLP